MRLPRTTARWAAPVLLSLAVAAPVAANQPVAGKPPQKIVFPVIGKTHYQDDFGAPRAQGGHQATDIMAEWRAPVVASEPGKVKLWTKSARAGCMLYLYGESGTEYLYVHLNNDLTARNDNKGGCRPGVAFAQGLRDGAEVRAGQLLGFVGDSGDANGIHHHVHFEVHPDGASAVSPYPWLRRAHELLYPTAAADPLMLTLRGVLVRSSDDALTLRVRSVELPTGERFDVDRVVSLAIAPAVLVERIAEGLARTAQLSGLRRGASLLVRTSPFEPNLAAQSGAPGALEAVHVVVAR